MLDETPDIDVVLGAVVGELQKRVVDAPEEIPAYILSKLFDYAVKKKAQEEARPAQVEEEERQNFLEWIENAGLPGERKQELLKTEILRLEQEMGSAYELLRGLEEGHDRAREADPPSES